MSRKTLCDLLHKKDKLLYRWQVRLRGREITILRARIVELENAAADMYAADQSDKYCKYLNKYPDAIID